MSELSQMTRKKLRSLQAIKGRQKHDLFLAEGIRVLEEALNFGRIPAEVYFDSNRLSERGQKLIESFSNSGCRAISAKSKDIDYISEAKTSQGIIGVFDIFTTDLSVEILRENRKAIFLDDISDPGNVGTIIRSALAFGFDPVVFSEQSVDPFNGKIIRSSAGAFFGRKIAVASIDTMMKSFNTKINLLAAQFGGDDIAEVLPKLSSDAALIIAIGSEASGLSEATRQQVDFNIGIKHDKKLESLNAAVAGSIIMHEVYKFGEGGNS